MFTTVVYIHGSTTNSNTNTTAKTKKAFPKFLLATRFSKVYKLKGTYLVDT